MCKMGQTFQPSSSCECVLWSGTMGWHVKLGEALLGKTYIWYVENKLPPVHKFLPMVHQVHSFSVSRLNTFSLPTPQTARGWNLAKGLKICAFCWGAEIMQGRRIQVYTVWLSFFQVFLLLFRGAGSSIRRVRKEMPRWRWTFFWGSTCQIEAANN